MSQVSVSVEGRRCYIRTPYGHPAVPRLKELGAHWDPDSKRWWLTSAKRGEVEQVLAASKDAPPAAENPDQIRLVGKAAYKGRNYYIRCISQDRRRCRLITLDAKIDFWADLGDGEGQAQVVKTYQPREYRGRTEYLTLGDIRAFIEQERDARQRGEPVCCECGKSGELVTDLEDGGLKHPWCCDIPPSGY